MEAIHLFDHDSDRRAFAAGHIVFAQGELRDCMYVVVAGEVEIRIDGVTIATAGPGSLIGEMALIDEGPRSSTVVARVASELVPIDQKRFLFLVQQTPKFALAVMKTLSERLRRTDEMIGGLLARSQRGASPG